MADKTEGVLAVLDAHEFDSKGYCLSCGGWMVSDNGFTPHAHEAGCAFVKAKAAIAELLAAAERNLANIDLINPPDGPFWSGANDQEALREAIRAMRGEP